MFAVQRHKYLLSILCVFLLCQKVTTLNVVESVTGLEFLANGREGVWSYKGTILAQEGDVTVLLEEFENNRLERRAFYSHVRTFVRLTF